MLNAPKHQTPTQAIRTVTTLPVTSFEAGESVTVVSNRLGHASAVETLSTYSHLWPDS